MDVHFSLSRFSLPQPQQLQNYTAPQFFDSDFTSTYERLYNITALLACTPHGPFKLFIDFVLCYGFPFSSGSGWSRVNLATPPQPQRNEFTYLS